MIDKLNFLPVARDYYNRTMSEILYYRSIGTGVCPYGLPFDMYFTPIERIVFGYIRCAGVPLLPEFPVDKYYIDFADPYLKVGIECDGQQWHDPKKDAKRDEELNELGWTIYRLTGAEIMRYVPARLEDEIKWEWQDINSDYGDYSNFNDYRNQILNEQLNYDALYAQAKLEKIFAKHFNMIVIVQ